MEWRAADAAPKKTPLLESILTRCDENEVYRVIQSFYGSPDSWTFFATRRQSNWCPLLDRVLYYSVVALRTFEEVGMEVVHVFFSSVLEASKQEGGELIFRGGKRRRRKSEPACGLVTPGFIHQAPPTFLQRNHRLRL